MHSHTTWYSRSAFRELVWQNDYDYIIISYIYWANLIDDIRSFSNARTIIDTHDFMTSQCQQNKNFQLGPFFEEEINRSEEHTYELQSLMRISYAVFCLKKKKK